MVIPRSGFLFRPIEGWKTKIISDFYGKLEIMLERKETAIPNATGIPITIITLSVEEKVFFVSDDKVKNVLFLSKPRLLTLKPNNLIMIDGKSAHITKYEATFESDDVIPVLEGQYVTIPINDEKYILLVKGASEKWESDKDFYTLLNSIHSVD